MSDFVVVDLGSQVRAVRRHIKGWKPDDVLEWLAQNGEVKAFPDDHGGYEYLFRSAAGKETGFFFNRNGEIVLIGDHTTY